MDAVINFRVSLLNYELKKCMYGGGGSLVYLVFDLKSNIVEFLFRFSTILLVIRWIFWKQSPTQ